MNRIVQYHTIDGVVGKKIDVGEPFVNDPLILMSCISGFIDPHDLLKIEFVNYKKLNAIKVETKNDHFYLTVYPTEEDVYKNQSKEENDN